MMRKRVAVATVITVVLVYLVAMPADAKARYPRCRVAALRLQVSAVRGRSQRAFQTTIENVSARSCVLAGYPEVAFDLVEDGDSHCSMPRGIGWGGIQRVVLGRNGVAAVSVVFLDGGSDAADIPRTLSLRLPGESAWVSIPWTSGISVNRAHRCGGPTHPGTYASAIYRLDAKR